VLRNRSIICFGGEDWWYHHPHSKAHLMRKFARAGNKVIFVNSISMGLPGLAHKDLLPRIKRKLGSYSKLARQAEAGITVVSPASLPFFGTAARAINRRLIGAQIRRLAQARGLTKPILWIAIPTAADMIGTLDESAVVYHVSDKYDANTMDHATDPALIRRLHEQAIDAADLIFYSGRKLFNEATRGTERSNLLEQGVDYDHWRRVGEGTIAMAPEIAAIPQPRLGYVRSGTGSSSATAHVDSRSKRCQTCTSSHRFHIRSCQRTPPDSTFASCHGKLSSLSRVTAQRSRCANTLPPESPW
jgi:hypothetical protein